MEVAGTPRQKDYLTADEARRLLDIRAQTLYAYVSRGWIHSVKQPGRKDRLYLRADVEKVRLRSRAHGGRAAVAASAMNFGEPIMATAITEITPQGPKYRGRPAEQLALTGATFETVSEFIWSGLWHEEDLRWSVETTPPEVRKVTNLIGPLRSNDQLLEIFALVALTLGVSLGSVADRIRSGTVIPAGRQLVQTLAGCFGFISRHGRFVPMRDGDTVVDGLVRSLDLRDTAENREALRTFLILFADHELSPGAFVARVAASSGATLHSCVATLGLKPRHELGVVATAIAMGLPKYTAGSLFALARTAGLVAHVQEQRLTPMLLRPRAKFMAD